MTKPIEDPLSEARPTSLDEFFSRNPTELSDSDIDIIVAELRKQREIWLQAEAQGKKSAPKGKKTVAKTTTPLSLEDLDL